MTSSKKHILQILKRAQRKNSILFGKLLSAKPVQFNPNQHHQTTESSLQDFIRTLV